MPKQSLFISVSLSSQYLNYKIKEAEVTQAKSRQNTCNKLSSHIDATNLGQQRIISIWCAANNKDDTAVYLKSNGVISTN